MVLLTGVDSSKDYRRRLGRYGEDLALHYLQKAGYEPFARNWRCRGGEIDLIVEKNEELVFVEVKTRAVAGSDWGEEAVDYRKKRKLALAVDLFFQQNPELDRGKWRLDIVVVELFHAKPRFVHYEDIEM